LDLLSERVGPHGTVVGLDQSAATTALARDFVSRRGLNNVEVVVGNARSTGLPRGSFDLAHMRLVLVNVPRPEEVVAELVTLVKPGGLVACHEADYVSSCCQPPHPAWERLMAVFAEVARGKGIDLFIGRRLPGLLRAAGLVDVSVKPLIYTYGHTDSARLLFPQFVDNAREEILIRGLLRENELTDLLLALRSHLNTPDILVISHVFLQVWGRKP
jgi:SAM-dependent methyltransferase